MTFNEPLGSKEIKWGHSTIARDKVFYTYLQTCIAFTARDPSGLIGMSHALCPSILEEDFKRAYEAHGGVLSESTIVNPRDALETLLSGMIESGCQLEDLSLGLFGGRLDNYQVGVFAADEAKALLKNKGLNAVEYVKTTCDIELVMTPAFYRVTLRNTTPNLEGKTVTVEW